jgi:hypothetical protein
MRRMLSGAPSSPWRKGTFCTDQVPRMSSSQQLYSSHRQNAISFQYEPFAKRRSLEAARKAHRQHFARQLLSLPFGE